MTTSWYIYMRPFTNLLQVAFRIYGHLPFQLQWIGRAFLAVMILPLQAIIALLGYLARYRARCRLQGFAHKGGSQYSRGLLVAAVLPRLQLQMQALQPSVGCMAFR